MSSTKKAAPKTTKAPTKNDTLRALRFMRKTLMECRVYDSRLYKKYEVESEAWRKAEQERKTQFIDKLPAASVKAALVGMFQKGKSHMDMCIFVTKLGYKPAPTPTSPRDVQRDLLNDIDKAIYDLMLGEFDSGIVAVFAKRIEELK